MNKSAVPSTMKVCTRIAVALVLLASIAARGADWPQWRGPNRDAKISDLKVPATWPGELAQKWKVTVGEGVATPALSGGKLFVFSRQEGNEVLRCLNAADGKELWQEKYETQGTTGPSQGFSGPRSSPLLADGKVITYGIRGTLSCVNAETGKVLWRKDDFAGVWPRFFTACSPIAVDGLCIVQLGGEEKGGIIAYDLASGEEKWKWTDDGTAYASPALINVDGTKMIATLTSKRLLGLSTKEGKLLWEVPFAVQGRGYNAATPIVEGQTVIISGSGRGTRAVKIEKTDQGFAAKEIWSNPEASVQFNTPVLAGGRLYGFTQNGELFCADAKAAKTFWSEKLNTRGFGSVVDAGSVLFALPPQGELTVLEPSETQFKKLASYKLGADTYAYPIISGNALYIKDKDSVTLWSIN